MFAIAGAAITARDAATPASSEALLGVGAAAKLAAKLKTAQDLFICIIVWALLAGMVGLAALHAHSSPSTKYEVKLGHHQSIRLINYPLALGQREERRGEEGRG